MGNNYYLEVRVMAILNRIRVINMYVLAFALIFLLQKYTLGFIPGFKDIVVFNKFYLHEIIFVLTSLVFVILFVRAGVPKSKDL